MRYSVSAGLKASSASLAQVRTQRGVPLLGVYVLYEAMNGGEQMIGQQRLQAKMDIQTSVLLFRLFRIPEARQHPILYKPVLVLGTNAILAYMVSELGEGILKLIHFSSGSNLKQVVVTAITTAIPSPQWSSLLYALLFLASCWLLVLPFYLKRLFLRI